MRIGLFFGSFNPPHLGHTIIASWMREAMNADEVWMVVSPQNPFKEQKDLLDEKKRLELVELAIKGLPGLKASDIEFDMERPSYTIDTMRMLTDRFPDDQFFLIMGSDNILHIDKWKEWEELLARFEIAVYPREDYEVLGSEFQVELPESVRFIDCPIIALSSTEVRRRIAFGQHFESLLRASVSEEIVSQGYYN